MRKPLCILLFCGLAGMAGAQDPGVPLPADPATGPKTESMVDPRLDRDARLATLLAELGQDEAANPEKTEEKIVELWSQSGSDIADLLLRRGRDAMNAEDYPTAIGHLTAAIELSPDFAEAWNARATAFYLREEFGLSLSDIEQTLALNPVHFGALAGLGMIMEQMGNEKAALAAFRASKAVNPHREVVNDAVQRLEPRVDGSSL